MERGREPRTLLIGLMVLALALTEGTANDWLALALVDGYGVEPWVGVTGFAVFVWAMTAAAWRARLLDRSAGYRCSGARWSPPPEESP